MLKWIVKDVLSDFLNAFGNLICIFLLIFFIQLKDKVFNMNFLLKNSKDCIMYDLSMLDKHRLFLKDKNSKIIYINQFVFNVQ